MKAALGAAGVPPRGRRADRRAAVVPRHPPVRRRPAGADGRVNLVVANGRTAAGGLPVAPLANPEDGLLDVVVIPAGDLLDLSVVAARLMAGDYHADETVLHRRARRVEVECDPPIPVSIDGELAEGRAVHVHRRPEGAAGAGRPRLPAGPEGGAARGRRLGRRRGRAGAGQPAVRADRRPDAAGGADARGAALGLGLARGRRTRVRLAGQGGDGRRVGRRPTGRSWSPSARGSRRD